MNSPPVSPSTPPRAVAGQAEDEQGTVEFVARYKVGGKAHRPHEISQFVREARRVGL